MASDKNTVHLSFAQAAKRAHASPSSAAQSSDDLLSNSNVLQSSQETTKVQQLKLPHTASSSPPIVCSAGLGSSLANGMNESVEVSQMTHNDALPMAWAQNKTCTESSMNYSPNTDTNEEFEQTVNLAPISTHLSSASTSTDKDSSHTNIPSLSTSSTIAEGFHQMEALTIGYVNAQYQGADCSRNELQSSSMPSTSVNPSIEHFRRDPHGMQLPSAPRRQQAQVYSPQLNQYLPSTFRPQLGRGTVNLPYNSSQVFPPQRGTSRPSPRLQHASPANVSQITQIPPQGWPGMMYPSYDAQQYFQHQPGVYSIQPGINQKFMIPGSPRSQLSQMTGYSPNTGGPNHSFSSPTYNAAHMARSVSGVADRPIASSPTPKRSSAIKIINPDTKSEVTVPKANSTPPVVTSAMSKSNLSRTNGTNTSDTTSIHSVHTGTTILKPLTESEKHERAEAARLAVLQKLESERMKSSDNKSLSITLDKNSESNVGKEIQQGAFVIDNITPENSYIKCLPEDIQDTTKFADRNLHPPIDLVNASENVEHISESYISVAENEEEMVDSKLLEISDKKKLSSPIMEATESSSSEMKAGSSKIEDLGEKCSNDTIAAQQEHDKCLEKGINFKTTKDTNFVTEKECRDENQFAMGPPTAVRREKKPTPNLSIEINSLATIPSKALTALLNAVPIENISTTDYPSAIQPPQIDVNLSEKNGVFKYDIPFLLQFQHIFTTKPRIDWDQRIRDTIGDPDDKRPLTSRAASGMGSRNSRASSTQSGMAGNFGMGMGTFGMNKGVGTSQQRFDGSTQQLRQGSSSSFGSIRGNLSRTSSMTNATGVPSSPKMGSRSQRGSRRDKPQDEPFITNQLNAEPVAPLVISANRWQPKRLPSSTFGASHNAKDSDHIAPDVVQRKVKGLLNKITLEKFDKISDQILEVASQSKNENDGRTLRQVIQLTFEKATDEPTWSNMYARFCRKMLENIDPAIRDESIVDKDGSPVTAGQLFRKYLLNRCQDEFERGWKANLPNKPEGDDQSKEVELLTDEYYVAATAKRRGLGLVKFIGELFKLSMLTERIMHECIKKLLAVVDDPEEEEVESLCKLLTTVGADLDREKGRKIMDAYIERMQKMLATDKLSSRIKFMILDVVDLRKKGWQGAAVVKGPMTIQEVHDQAAKQKTEDSTGRQSQRGSSNTYTRPQFGKGDARGQNAFSGVSIGSGGNNLWQDVSSSRQSNQNRNAGDISRLGQFRMNSGNGSFGPQTGFPSLQSSSGKHNSSTGNQIVKSDSNPSSRPATPPTNSASASSTNIFDLLSGGDGESHEIREDLSTQPEISMRTKLNLLPRSNTASSDEDSALSAEIISESGPTQSPK